MKKRLKGWVNGALEKAFGWKIYSVRAHGRDDVADIKSSGISVRTIFDVGANVGQSVDKFRAAFPGAHIYSFEPVSHLFRELQEVAAEAGKAEVFNLALGAEPGRARIHLREHQTTHSLVDSGDALGSQEVEVETLDRLCGKLGIDHIGLLKVDVEGFDLEVLRGAQELLSTGRVDFILVELGFNPDDPRHVPFDAVRDLLIPWGYRTYGIYDQQLEWSGEHRLRFANVCFAWQRCG